MDDFHERLARLALARIGGAGFCLAGGYAVRVHGILDRPSEDIDLFTTAEAAGQFARSVADVVPAYREAELTVSILDEHAGFARLAVSDARSGAASKVELAIDWRAHPPVILDIGPVLHADGAVANKVNALNSRAQARYYIDVDAAVRSGATRSRTSCDWPSSTIPVSSLKCSPEHCGPSGGCRTPSSRHTACPWARPAHSRCA